jgi:hypothetical protein
MLGFLAACPFPHQVLVRLVGGVGGTVMVEPFWVDVNMRPSFQHPQFLYQIALGFTEPVSLGLQSCGDLARWSPLRR